MDPFTQNIQEANAAIMRVRIHSRHIDAKQFYALILYSQSNFSDHNYSSQDANRRRSCSAPTRKRTYSWFYALLTLESMNQRFNWLHEPLTTAIHYTHSIQQLDKVIELLLAVTLA